jgi:DNA polymerase-3 subunit delta
VLHGDEPLLQQEAADAIRAAARARATPSAAASPWPAPLRLERRAGGRRPEPVCRPADRRDPHPSGKPGKDGSAALQQIAQQAGNDAC